MNKNLLTLIVDKIDRRALLVGANKPSSWRSYVENEYCIFSRIKSLSYSKIHYENSSKKTYDHCIRYKWKELFGPGQKEEIGCGIGIQDEVGNWHYPIDEGGYIYLWHPSKQSFHETILFTDIHWRPIYDYNSDEVVDAVKTICKTFNLEFFVEDEGKWTTLSCGCGGITILT